MVMTVETMVTPWGTWEELLLGGAVLRYGTADWDVIAGELQSRSLSPENFTSEICKAKYEDLQQRYSGCKSWFEELKKKRMEELRAALQKSENSIGSLESKLQNLKAEENNEDQNDYDSSRTESVGPCEKSEGAECTSKDTYLSSAGSFTQQGQANWTSETKQETPRVIEKDGADVEKVVETVYGGGQVLPSMRKPRGNRKRKDWSKDVKESVNVFESDALVSSASVSRCYKETSTSRCSWMVMSDGPSGLSRGHNVLAPDELMKMYNNLAPNEFASVFRKRLDSQKRGRYKKTVRQHMDFDTIQSKIRNGSISTAKELYRDLLLVANNVIIFYSKNTREHKSAVSLRDFVIKSLRQYLTEEDNRNHNHESITKPKMATRMMGSVRKPRSAHPLPPKTRFGKTAPARQEVVKTASGGKRMFGTDSPKPAAVATVGSTGMATASGGRKRGRVR